MVPDPVNIGGKSRAASKGLQKRIHIARIAKVLQSERQDVLSDVIWVLSAHLSRRACNCRKDIKDTI